MVRKLIPNSLDYYSSYEELKKKRKKKQHENLHDAFVRVLSSQAHLMHGMVDEHKFHPVRKFAFDFAWPHLKIGVDIQGGIYSRGRRTGHTSIKGMENDMEKLNCAITNGWLMLLLSPNKIKQQPEYVRRIVSATISLRKKEGF